MPYAGIGIRIWLCLFFSFHFWNLPTANPTDAPAVEKRRAFKLFSSCCCERVMYLREQANGDDAEGEAAAPAEAE